MSDNYVVLLPLPDSRHVLRHCGSQWILHFYISLTVQRGFLEQFSLLYLQELDDFLHREAQ